MPEENTTTEDAAEKTYHFTVVLEQTGANEQDAWEQLLGYIADAPTEAIDRYESVQCVDDDPPVDLRRAAAR